MSFVKDSRNPHLSLKSGFASPKRNFAPFQVDPLSIFMPFVEKRMKSSKRRKKVQQLSIHLANFPVVVSSVT